MLRKTILMIVVLLLGVASVQAQDAPRDLTLFLTYIPNIQFAPVYVALEKGYFADAGLNVTIQHGDEPDGVNLIAANQLQFGVASGEQVIAARAQGRPVVFVYEWFQQYPVGVLVTDDSGIGVPADLEGRTIGIPGLFGASYTGVIALLAANGLTEQDVQLQSIGFNAPQVICVDGVQAAVIYVNNEPLQVQDRIDNNDCGSVTGISVFPVGEAADMVSNGIVTNEETIATDPELVAAFVAAFDRGLRDTINNPSAAYLISARYVDGLPLPGTFRTALEGDAAMNEILSGDASVTRDAAAQARADLLDALSAQFASTTLLQFKVLLTSIAMWDADQLGYTDPASWQLTEDTLMSMGLLTEPVDLTGSYRNDFLPENP